MSTAPPEPPPRLREAEKRGVGLVKTGGARRAGEVGGAGGRIVETGREPGL